MLKSISLQNYKSFGRRVTVPLEPITVLVGPNNSGKSCFMSLGRLVANALDDDGRKAITKEGGAEYLFHRPLCDNGDVELVWETNEGKYTVALSLDNQKQVFQRLEAVQHVSHGRAHWPTLFDSNNNPSVIDPVRGIHVYPQPFFGLCTLTHRGEPNRPDLLEITKPMANSRLVKLSPDALRKDSKVVPNPTLSNTGEGMPAVLALWRGAEP